MRMLAAYFDDSGTHDDSAVVCWGGFIGTDRQWASFDGEWRAKLGAPLSGKPVLRKFGLADCERQRNEFFGYSVAESDLLQNEMREIIVKHRLLGVCYSVDRRAWDRLVKGRARELLGDAEVACFSACFEGAVERANKYFPQEHMLSLHFDQGRQSPKLHGIIQIVRTEYSGKPELVNISFDLVEKVAPLQAADVIATENYWHAKGVLDGKPSPRPHFDHFLKRVSTEGYILEESQIMQTLRDREFS
jgi:hypothetical protein